MSYTTLDEYQRKWIFTHQSMPLPAEDLEKIKPMTQARASQFWKENVSPQSPDAERLSSQDWPSKASNWNEEISWMANWEADEPEMPEEILNFIDWQDDVTVYFCYENITFSKLSGQFLRNTGRTFCSTMMAQFC